MLKNANLFVFSSLTRNFALTLSKVLPLEKTQIYLVFCSLIRTFVGEYETTDYRNNTYRAPGGLRHVVRRDEAAEAGTDTA